MREKIKIKFEKNEGKKRELIKTSNKRKIQVKDK